MSYNIFEVEMGGVITVIEAAINGGLFGMGIAQIVLKNKLKELIQPHKEQFALMDQLYKFVDILMKQQGLVSQLSSNTLFVTQNWNMIRNDLQDKNDHLKKIIQRFPDIKTAGFQYNFTNGLLFGVSILALGYMSYNVVSGKVKTQLIGDYNAFMEFARTSAAKIRSLAPIIKSTSINAEGIIQITTHGTNNETVPPQTRTSKTQKAKAQEQQGIYSKVTIGLRLIYIAVAIYGFVTGVQNMIHLTEQIEKYEKYFKEEGEFQKSKEGVIQVMGLVAADLFGLGNAARAGFYDSRIMLLILSVGNIRHQDTFVRFSRMLNTQQHGLNDTFIDESKLLIDSCNTIKKSEMTSKQKLKELQHNFRKFFTKMTPQTILGNATITLSKVVSQFSALSGLVEADTGRSRRVLESFSQYFLDYRDEDFPDRNPARKQELDTKIITKSFQKFKTIYQLDKTLQIQNADDYLKDIIFQVTISYADDFYYDDISGKTLFNKNIKAAKTDISYKELFDRELSKSQKVPVRRTKDQDEEKEVQYWVGLAKKKNQDLGLWDKNIHPQATFRYLRIFIEDYINSQGEKLQRMVSLEGINLLVSKHGLLDPEYYRLQRDIFTEAITLQRVLE